MTQVSGAPQHPTDFLGRVQWAVNYRGWRDLGSISGQDFRESDVEYDPASGHYYVFSTHPADTATVMRHAANLTDMVNATAVASGVGSGTWYPSVRRHENGDWYLFGTSSSSSTSWGTSTGGPPTGAVTLTGTPTFADNPGGQIDADFVRVQISGTYYWFMCANSGTLYNGRQLLRIYRHADSLITGVNNWAKLQGTASPPQDIFQNIGYPSWARDANPDPNLVWPGDGRLYCAFTGTTGTTHTAGIVELQLTGTPAINGAYAIGTPIPLTTSLTDICYLHCPDGVDRLFGFSSVGGTNWACLELP